MKTIKMLFVIIILAISYFIAKQGDFVDILEMFLIIYLFLMTGFGEDNENR